MENRQGGCLAGPTHRCRGSHATFGLSDLSELVNGKNYLGVPLKLKYCLQKEWVGKGITQHDWHFNWQLLMYLKSVGKLGPDRRLTKGFQ